LGGLLLAAAFIVPFGWPMMPSVAVGKVVGQFGAAMFLGGVQQMLAPQVNSNYEDQEQPTSDLFSSALNVTTPGMPVPVLVGECEVGSVVVSAAIHVEDRINDA
jgi:predicted phage tail protein